MKILIEEYGYAPQYVEEILQGLESLKNKKGLISTKYVGYYYNPYIEDCVFFLPKVLLDENNLVFGHIKPEELVDIERYNDVHEDEKKFIYEFSVWIYRALSVYDDRNDNVIVYRKRAELMGGRRRFVSNTFLDIIMALVDFNKENQDYLMFVLRNLHSGLNKINWTKSISHSTAIILNTTPIYTNLINKKRQINFDEELLVIYYSILNYINEKYGFKTIINVGFNLIKGKQFDNYLKGYGSKRLKQIKYKYFSDKALTILDMCMAFFDRASKIQVGTRQQEYLICKEFEYVFQAIVDDLIAGDQPNIEKLKLQDDGKRLDHLFQYKEIVYDDSDKEIYYVGDSKYYPKKHPIPPGDINKQFTYVKNIIQWNMDLFNDRTDEELVGQVKLRDDETEGYNIIPNFFISSHQETLNAEDNIQLSSSKKPYHFCRHFENRLFDRDTLLLTHYDVNFLFVVSLYGRNKNSAKTAWRHKVKELFRKNIKEMLEEHFLFYAMTAKEGIDPDMYMHNNFQSVLGKVFQPFKSRGDQKYYSLALRNPDKIELGNKEREKLLRNQIAEENESIRFLLEQSFYVEKCKLGEDPQKILPNVDPIPHKETKRCYLTRHYLENYEDTFFLVGGFRDYQLEWMFGRAGGKRDDAYNVRIGKKTHGGVVKSRDEIKHAKFVILYEFGKESNGVYKTFRVKNTGELNKDDMIKYGYNNPGHDKYLCYFFDEEVYLGEFNIEKIIEEDIRKYNKTKKKSQGSYPYGRPIYIEGKELIKFKKDE